MLIELSGGTVIPRPLPAYIMGIVNATPDSFWEGSRLPSLSSVKENAEFALSLVEEGCDILDIGAESSRPGADYVPAEDEISRLIPLIQEIRKYSSVPVSVDTRKASVMKAAFEAGADILNDISALEDDCDMASFAATAGIPVILMHKRGVPKTMQVSLEKYTDAPEEILRYLLSRADFAMGYGIKKEKIILDPGIGFGKQYEDNLAVIKHIDIFAESGYNVVMGLSRKTCIGGMTGRNVEDRLAGTLAAEMFSVMHGVSVLRVHDVKETKDMLSVLQELKK